MLITCVITIQYFSYHNLKLENIAGRINSEKHVLSLNLPHNESTVDFSVFERRSSKYTENEAQVAYRHPSFFLYLVKTENPFFVCMAPKTGSTEWKSLFAYVNGGPNYFHTVTEAPGNVHNDKAFLDFMLPRIKEKIANDLLRNSSRILITRNPYERFLSGYFDWLHRHEISTTQVSFTQFLSMAEDNSFEEKGYQNTLANHHFQSVSELSRFKDIQYSAILRLEEQDLWYRSFIKTHKLAPFLAQLTKEGTPFYAPKSNLHDTIFVRMEQVLGKSPWKGENLNKVGHVAGSASKLFKFYSPDLARRVFDLYRDDFINFGYPAWNGDPSSFHYM